MALRGITSPQKYDPWVIRQFQSLDGGMPYVEGDYLSPVSTASAGAVTSGASGATGGSGGAVANSSLQVNGTDISQGTQIGPAVLPQVSPLPTATTATMPTVTGTANAWVGRQTGMHNGQRGGKTPRAITPEYLNQRLPSIVNPAPVNVGPPPCGGGIVAWVGENPGLAAAGLVLLAWWAWGRE
jgi:hypothetical protein